MTYRLVLNEDDIYLDEGEDHGLVSSVTWAHIHLIDSLAGTYVLMVIEGGCTTIGDGEFIVEKIYIHPESDGIWIYGRDPNTNQIWMIEFPELYRYECGIGQPPQI